MQLPIIKDENFLDTFTGVELRHYKDYAFHQDKIVNHNKKILYVGKYSMYWKDVNKILMYEEENVVYLNSSCRKNFRLEKMAKLKFKDKDLIWKPNEHFGQYIIGLDYIKFKSVKQMQETIPKFKQWLSNKTNLQNFRNTFLLILSTSHF